MKIKRKQIFIALGILLSIAILIYVFNVAKFMILYRMDIPMDYEAHEMEEMLKDKK